MKCKNTLLSRAPGISFAELHDTKGKVSDCVSAAFFPFFLSFSYMCSFCLLFSENAVPRRLIFRRVLDSVTDMVHLLVSWLCCLTEKSSHHYAQLWETCRVGWRIPLWPHKGPRRRKWLCGKDSSAPFVCKIWARSMSYKTTLSKITRRRIRVSCSSSKVGYCFLSVCFISTFQLVQFFEFWCRPLA